MNRDADLSRVASVASFFISRTDAEVDERLDAVIERTSGLEEMVRELAEQLGCELRGDGEREVNGVAGIEDAGPGDVTFLAEELQAVFDPKGGYFKPGGRFMPSIIAEIGDVIAHHMQKIGLMEKEELSEQQKLILSQKRAEAEGVQNPGAADKTAEAAGYPASATLCNKCNTKAVVVMDNCATCLSCGYSKCG